MQHISELGLRPIQQSDVQVLVRLDTGALCEWPVQRWLDQLNGPNCYGMCLCDLKNARRIYAVCAFWTTGLRALYLRRVCVDPRFRRSGLGTLMVMQTVSLLNKDCDHIFSVVYELDTVACEFFVACQFHVHSYDPSVHELVFEYPMDEGARVIERLFGGNDRVLRPRFEQVK